MVRALRWPWAGSGVGGCGSWWRRRRGPGQSALLGTRTASPFSVDGGRASSCCSLTHPGGKRRTDAHPSRPARRHREDGSSSRPLAPQPPRVPKQRGAQHRPALAQHYPATHHPPRSRPAPPKFLPCRRPRAALAPRSPIRQLPFRPPTARALPPSLSTTERDRLQICLPARKTPRNSETQPCSGGPPRAVAENRHAAWLIPQSQATWPRASAGAPRCASACRHAMAWERSGEMESAVRVTYCSTRFPPTRHRYQQLST